MRCVVCCVWHACVCFGFLCAVSFETQQQRAQAAGQFPRSRLWHICSHPPTLKRPASSPNFSVVASASLLGDLVGCGRGTGGDSQQCCMHAPLRGDVGPCTCAVLRCCKQGVRLASALSSPPRWRALSSAAAEGAARRCCCWVGGQGRGACGEVERAQHADAARGRRRRVPRRGRPCYCAPWRRPAANPGTAHCPSPVPCGGAHLNGTRGRSEAPATLCRPHTPLAPRCMASVVGCC